MIVGIKDSYPLLNKGIRNMARCRLCSSTMLGIFDFNMRFYCECCYPVQAMSDVYPRRKKPILIKGG